MATLTIITTPSANLEHYRLWVDDAADDDFVPMDPQDDGTERGTYEIAGQCGSGSAHRLRYVLVGPQGASLGLARLCDGNPGSPMPTVRIFEFSPAGGEVDFVL